MPAGLRLSTQRRTRYRVDREPPGEWTWPTYPRPRSRFDSAAGIIRVRYAADAKRTALRERFDTEERKIDARALTAQLVELTGAVRVLDLRRDQTLDALGIDDQVSTARSFGVWQACHHLVDLVYEWFGEQCDGLVYRSRTTPERSANLAFFSHAALTARPLGNLRAQDELLLQLIAADGFQIMGWR